MAGIKRLSENPNSDNLNPNSVRLDRQAKTRYTLTFQQQTLYLPTTYPACTVSHIGVLEQDADWPDGEPRSLGLNIY
jgi:hypothetical protein